MAAGPSTHHALGMKHVQDGRLHVMETTTNRRLATPTTETHHHPTDFGKLKWPRFGILKWPR